VGFVFTSVDPFTGIDLDKCRDPETASVEPWAQSIVDFLDSYTEISPSGRGLHIIVMGTLPETGRRKDRVEMYSSARYFTMTGNRLPGTSETIEVRQEELQAQYDALLKPIGTMTPPGSDDRLFFFECDDELVQHALRAKNGDKFRRLWQGKWDGYPSQNEADEALCCILCFWTSGDRVRVDRLFRRSGLYRPKWDEKHYADGRTYGEGTIDKAIDFALVEHQADVQRYPSLTIEQPRRIRPAPQWPVLSQDAFHGPIGDFVSLIEPHTEADPAALLLQALVAFGNLLNRGPYFITEKDRHGMNLFVVLVGETAKGRKGSSWGHVRDLWQAIDPDWASTRIQSGLSSGEGMMWAVHDEITKVEAVKKNGKYTGEYQTVVVEPAIEDKRLLILEPEFASTLTVIRRDGNTLSAMIRQAWDTGELRALTKNKKADATEAHISIIGHITRDEVLRLLDTTEAVNGFANRILWACVRRSKCLPEGGRLHDVNKAPIIHKLSRAVQFGRAAGEMKRDDSARACWRQVYPALSHGKPGQFGGIISRAEAQVVRLSALYAIADQSPLIKGDHLKAALALWKYCEDSARYIFGERLGDPMADELLSVLRSSSTGMTRTEIMNWFGRNKKGAEIERALHVLERHNLACHAREQTSIRPTERWLAI
jgi:hypothetical protein